jgi:hypothetical protein
MSIREIIQYLKQILDNNELSTEERQAIENAISILENNKSKNRDQLINVAKILADLISVGVKIFDS